MVRFVAPTPGCGKKDLSKVTMTSSGSPSTLSDTSPEKPFATVTPTGMVMDVSLAINTSSGATLTMICCVGVVGVTAATQPEPALPPVMVTLYLPCFSPSQVDTHSVAGPSKSGVNVRVTLGEVLFDDSAAIVSVPAVPEPSAGAVPFITPTFIWRSPDVRVAVIVTGVPLVAV